MPTLRSHATLVQVRLSCLSLLFFAILSGCSAPNPGFVSDKVNPRLALASAYYQNGQFRVALEESQKVLDVSANDPQALALHGLIYMRLDAPALAQKSFLLAEKTAPVDADIAHNHAVFFFFQRLYKAAFERFETAMRQPLYREKAKTLWVWGVCADKSGDVESAQRLWIQSLSIQPAADSALALALSLKQHNQIERAALVLKNFNQSDVVSAQTLWLGAQLARQLSDADSLKSYAAILRQRFPNSPQWGAFQREAFDDPIQ
jgi:type IV pilus assembly protein PilF